MSSHENSHDGSQASLNSGVKPRHHRQPSWPISDYVQKPTLALVSVLLQMRSEPLAMFRISPML